LRRSLFTMIVFKRIVSMPYPCKFC
jgi:hypothetical protein